MNVYAEPASVDTNTIAAGTLYSQNEMPLEISGTGGFVLVVNTGDGATTGEGVVIVGNYYSQINVTKNSTYKYLKIVEVSEDKSYDASLISRMKENSNPVFQDESNKDYVKVCKVTVAGSDKYQISFNSYDGAEVINQDVTSVEYNEDGTPASYEVTLPTPRDRSGYEFKGWKMDENEYAEPGTVITTSRISFSGEWQVIQPAESGEISGRRYLGAETPYTLPSGTHTVSGESGITYEGGSTFYVASTGYYTIN